MNATVERPALLGQSVQFVVKLAILRAGPARCGVVANQKATEQFWQTWQIDTDLYWADKGNRDAIVATIEDPALAARCQPGDMVDYTIEIFDRKNGFRGIRGVDLKVR
jgi:hypothetical protein